jgi:hypothetical protein
MMAKLFRWRNFEWVTRNEDGYLQINDEKAGAGPRGRRHDRAFC